MENKQSGEYAPTDAIVKHLKHKIKYLKKRVDEFKDYNHNEHTFHGGHAKGYWIGSLSQAENLLDFIEGY